MKRHKLILFALSAGMLVASCNEVDFYYHAGSPAKPGDVKCGNNKPDAGEVCDGDKLNGETCASQGFRDGVLKCKSTCDGFDTSACTKCGDGVKNGDEACDGKDLGGMTSCASGFEGTPSCDAECKIVGCTPKTSICDGKAEGFKICAPNDKFIECVDNGGKIEAAPEKSCASVDSLLPKCIEGTGSDSAKCGCAAAATRCETTGTGESAVHTLFTCGAENTWNTGTACDPGYVCSTDGMKCVKSADYCETDGKKKCDGTSLLRCTGNLWKVENTCGTKEDPDTGYPIQLYCHPKSFTCETPQGACDSAFKEGVFSCSPYGVPQKCVNRFLIEQTACTGDKPVCNKDEGNKNPDLACVECNNGVKKCELNKETNKSEVKTCKNHKFVDPEICMGACEDAQTCGTCTPGETKCQTDGGEFKRVCRDDHTWSDPIDCGTVYPGSKCKNNDCQDPHACKAGEADKCLTIDGVSGMHQCENGQWVLLTACNYKNECKPDGSQCETRECGDGALRCNQNGTQECVDGLWHINLDTWEEVITECSGTKQCVETCPDTNPKCGKASCKDPAEICTKNGAIKCDGVNYKTCENKVWSAAKTCSAGEQCSNVGGVDACRPTAAPECTNDAERCHEGKMQKCVAQTWTDQTSCASSFCKDATTCATLTLETSDANIFRYGIKHFTLKADAAPPATIQVVVDRDEESILLSGEGQTDIRLNLSLSPATALAGVPFDVYFNKAKAVPENGTIEIKASVADVEAAKYGLTIKKGVSWCRTHASNTQAGNTNDKYQIESYIENVTTSAASIDNMWDSGDVEHQIVCANTLDLIKSEAEANIANKNILFYKNDNSNMITFVNAIGKIASKCIGRVTLDKGNIWQYCVAPGGVAKRVSDLVDTDLSVLEQNHEHVPGYVAFTSDTSKFKTEFYYDVYESSFNQFYTSEAKQKDQKMATQSNLQAEAVCVDKELAFDTELSEILKVSEYFQKIPMQYVRKDGNNFVFEGAVPTVVDKDYCCVTRVSVDGEEQSYFKKNDTAKRLNITVPLAEADCIDLNKTP